jgi:hypothetical protein
MKTIGNPFHVRAFEELIRPLIRTNAALKVKQQRKSRGPVAELETGVRRLKRGKENWTLTTLVKKKTNNQQEYSLDLALSRTKIRFRLPWTESMLKALSSLRTSFISWMRKTPEASGWVRPTHPVLVKASTDMPNDNSNENDSPAADDSRISNIRILEEGEPMEAMAKGYTPAQKKKRATLTAKIQALRLTAQGQLKTLQKLRAKLAPLRAKKRALRKQGKKASPALQQKINKLMPQLEAALDKTRSTRDKISAINKQIKSLKKAAGFKVAKKKKRRALPELRP